MDITGPVSKPKSICIMATPVASSPASIALCIGAAPLHLGSNDAWIFKQPARFGFSAISKTSFGKIKPYAATTMTSKSQSLNSLSALAASAAYLPSNFKDVGCITLICFSSANCLTGLACKFMPRPAGLSG